MCVRACVRACVRVCVCVLFKVTAAARLVVVAATVLPPSPHWLLVEFNKERKRTGRKTGRKGVWGLGGGGGGGEGALGNTVKLSSTVYLNCFPSRPSSTCIGSWRSPPLEPIRCAITAAEINVLGVKAASPGKLEFYVNT